MLRKQPWFKFSQDLHIELLQAKDEGKDISSFEEKVKKIMAMDEEDPQKEVLAAAIYDEIEMLPVEEGYKYFEPSDLEGIKDARPKDKKSYNHENLHREDAFNKIYGAWLGRCAGCLLGKPVEGWMSDRLEGLLKDTGNYPLNDYISSNIDEEIKKKYNMDDKRAWIDKVCRMPEDDDTNYTVIGLKLLETYGTGFTQDDAAECWLQNLPILHVCTAERIAYRNLVSSIYPPHSASFRNPYREWIGAQIRADFFGYINIGNTERAAEFAWRDASISHTKNGIYGEMFVAAMLAAAAATDDVYEIIQRGLNEIPEKSRMTEYINLVLSWKRQGLSADEAFCKFHNTFNEKSGHDWCHAISNAMVVCLGLLYGELDLEKSICLAVAAGFDTDCNGATVGSIVGMILGAKGLPGKWIAPLNDELQSGVDGFGIVKISEMAERTMKFVGK